MEKTKKRVRKSRAKVPEKKKTKMYVIREGVTQTIVTEYLIEAESYEQAKANYKHSGQYNGDWVGNSIDDEGVKVLN